MQKQYSIADAKNKLPSIIHQVEKGPCIKLTRRGKPVAVLLSIGEFERLSISNTGFWNALVSFRQRINSEGLTFSGNEFQGLRDPSLGREVDWD